MAGRRTLFIVLSSFAQATAAVAAESGGVDGGRMMTVFWLLMVVAVSLFVYIIIAAMRRERQQRVTRPDADDRMDFMVGTFHELVQRLKDKERELDELRKHAEERADKSESYTEDILQSVPSGVISFDNSMRITQVNAAAERVLGVVAGDCIGRGPRDVVHGRLADIIVSAGELDRQEVVYESPAGVRAWLGLNLSPLRNKSGETIGKILVFTDLTALKALESQVRLRESLTTLGEMSAGIAHELRNPMGVISGHTRLLSRKVPDGLKDSVVAIEREIMMMNRIITDFMSFAHPVALNRVPFDAAALVRDVTGSVLEGRPDIVLDAELPSCTVRADDALIRQVFSNLIQNAADAMREGGRLGLKLEAGPAQVTVSVADSGHGIQPEIRDKIFIPFYTTKEKGTGLGLAIVHKIVISHGGTITFETSPSGTKFSVSLPLAQA